MSKSKALASGNAPRPTTTSIELADAIAGKFRQEFGRMVEELDREGLDSERFRSFLGDLRDLVNGIGKEALAGAMERLDVLCASIEQEGERLRYRGASTREWLTMFGKVEVSRSVYRGNGAGAAKCVPLDVATGMVGRYMTPDVEEPAAMANAMLPQLEAEQLLAKVLPEGPSATAIRNAVEKLGDELGERQEAVERAIQKEAPLSTTGDILALSWDGVMVPMREADNANTAWREAGVATVSVYGPGEEAPERHDVRYMARMPESRMATLVDRVVAEASKARARHSFRETVVICDGNKTNWTQAEAQSELQDAIFILDFYHTSENLMKAARAIFGDTDQARHWHEKVSFKLQTECDGVERALRSMRRYRATLRRGSRRRKDVANVMAYFSNNRERMRYADFLARGLPIGSGPVEAAAKTIVQARLKRSGMRWSMHGGQHILDLRAHLKSNRWDVMWSALKKAA